MVKDYFYKLLVRYLSIYIRPNNTLVEVNPLTNIILKHFVNTHSLILSNYLGAKSQSLSSSSTNDVLLPPPDYILLSGNIHYEKDIQKFLSCLKNKMNSSTRLIIIYYSSLWRPLMRLATFLKLRNKTPELNWIAPEDIENFLRLTDYELIRQDKKVLIPIYIPILSFLINRFIAPLPFFRQFTLVNIVIAKPKLPLKYKYPSVSIVVPARNEAGNIENLIKRIPALSDNDEIIFVEGNSTDNTWQIIQDMYHKYKHDKNIVITQQEGTGKGDAVRKGFSIASKDILMILDADLTVPAEELSKFYYAIAEGKGDFINGSRLVYPMEKQAMRFFNILGNKFFALGFSFVLGQRFKDTLCGTKVLSREIIQN
jgi:hypothetical protein